MHHFLGHVGPMLKMMRHIGVSVLAKCAVDSPGLGACPAGRLAA